MSWLERVNNAMVITTGDGKKYQPLWMNATKSKEYNISEFEFVGVKGTKAHRGLPKGRKFNIEIYFTGEDHLDVVEAFEESADDSRDWKISHPKYGSITVAPVSLLFDDKADNVTKITGALIETIADAGPRIRVDPVDKILADKLNLDVTFEGAFVNDVPAPDAATVNSLAKNNLSFYTKGFNFTKTADQAEAYFNTFSEASSAILNATEAPLAAIRAIQAVINAPPLFIDTVTNRINNILTELDVLRLTYEGLTGKSQKKVYENNGGVLVSGMCQASVTDYSYANRDEVLETIDKITGAHDQYLEDLDGIQDETANAPESYIPDAGSQQDLSDLVSFTIGNLFDIAKNAKQQRSLYLEDDSNVVLLAHRFYGLLADDSTIDTFIATNKIGLDELIQVKKGRLITYYI